MNNSKNKTSVASKSWNSYWSGTSDTSAFTNGGVSHPNLKIYWQGFFSNIAQGNSPPSIIDIASGNGALIEYAHEFSVIKGIKYTSLDISPAAIENIVKRYPNVNGIVSDAASTKLKSKSFDFVISQFGVEYAGIKAIDEAARLVANKGTLSLLLHIKPGYIYQECLDSFNAIKKLQESQFIPISYQVFEAGFAAVRGDSREPYEHAAKRLTPAIQQIESIMREYGQHVAGDTVQSLYNDVAKIHQRMKFYEPRDVLGWLKRMEIEIESYAERMSSMNRAALNKIQFNKIVNNIQELGFNIKRAEPLKVENSNLPIAWVLIAEK